MAKSSGAILRATKGFINKFSNIGIKDALK
jgi:hypothetical protein